MNKELIEKFRERNIKIIKNLPEERLKKDYKEKFIELIKKFNFIIDSGEEKHSILKELKSIGLKEIPVIQFLSSYKKDGNKIEANVVKVSILKIETAKNVSHVYRYTINYDEKKNIRLKNIKLGDDRSITMEQFANLFSIKNDEITEKLINFFKNKKEELEEESSSSDEDRQRIRRRNKRTFSEIMKAPIRKNRKK